MSDAELIALAALANAETVLMAGDNQQREKDGYAPAWRDGCGFMHFTTLLYDEMWRRISRVNEPVSTSGYP
jgi:hypothetical protein